jgi:hypothetical protein
MDSLDVSNFDLNAILRGAQLTLVGGRSWSPLHRSQALTCASSKSSSPESGHLHVGPLPPSCHCCSSRDCHSSYCCRAGSLLPYSSTKTRLTRLQVVAVRALLWLLSLVVNMDHTTWDESVVNGLHFLEHTVLQVPFFLMTMMRYVTPTLDRM